MNVLKQPACAGSARLDPVYEAAVRLYREENLRRFPFDPRLAINRRGYYLMTFDEYADASGFTREEINEAFDSDGFVRLQHNSFCIVYNEQSIPARIRWTLTHELCHIFLGHIGSDEQTLLRRSCKKDALDCEADRMTAEVLCPLELIGLLGLSNVKELRAVTGLSEQAAVARMLAYDRACEAGTITAGALHAYLERYCCCFIEEYHTQRDRIRRHEEDLHANRLLEKIVAQVLGAQ